MKRIVALFAIAGIALAAAGAQSALDIVKASRRGMKADTMSTRSRLVIASKDGNTTERMLDQYTAVGATSVRTVIIFQKPASVAGTRFLTIQNEGKPEDRWIFLPSLGKVRRVASGEGSGSFMGTDFSYDDISLMNRDPGLDAYSILRDETLDGKECRVIEARPNDPGFQYSRMLLWIDKAGSSTLKTELYDRKGELAKVLEIQAYREIQGRLTAVATKMSTVQAKTSTTIFMDIVKYDDPIPASVFTEKFLLTGKP